MTTITEQVVAVISCPSAPAPPPRDFGALTAVGHGGVSVPVRDGTYGEFAVAGGICTPNTSPLTVGTANVGATVITVISGVAHCSTYGELNTAMAAALPGGGRTLRCRGTFSSAVEIVSPGAETPTFTDPVTIDAEPGCLFSNGLTFTHWGNVILTGLTVTSPTLDANTSILRLVGDNGAFTILDCHIYGTTRDPFGDYSDGSYTNAGLGVKTDASGRGDQVGKVTMHRCLIEHVRTATTFTPGPGGLECWWNLSRYVYNDHFKYTPRTDSGLISWRYNWGHSSIGRGSDVGNPHVDFIQCVSGGGTALEAEFIGNVYCSQDTAARGTNFQILVGFEDGDFYARFASVTVAGNLFMTPGVHGVNLNAAGGVFHYNTVIITQPTDESPIDGAFSIRLNAPDAGVSFTGNLLKSRTSLGAAFVTRNEIFPESQFEDFMTGPTWRSPDFDTIIASYTPKAGGPGDGLGAHAIMTFGQPLISEGWAVDESKLTPIIAATTPDIFNPLRWSVADLAVGDRVTLTIALLPGDGSSALTDIEWRPNTDADPVALGATTAGAYVLTGLTQDVAQSIQIRAVNAVGNGAWSAVKSVTPTMEAGVESVPLISTSVVASTSDIPVHNSGDLLFVSVHRTPTGNMGNLTDMTGWTMLATNGPHLNAFWQVSDGTPTSVACATAEGICVSIYRPTSGSITIGAAAALTGGTAGVLVPALTLLDTAGKSRVVAMRTNRETQADEDIFSPDLVRRVNCAHRVNSNSSVYDSDGEVATWTELSAATTSAWRTISVEVRPTP